MIKPLFLFSEEEIILYCSVKNLPYFSEICKNAIDFPILRKKVQLFLNTLDERSYELKYNTIKFHLQLNELKQRTQSSNDVRNTCAICSYPTGPNRIICTYCEFKQSFIQS